MVEEIKELIRAALEVGVPTYNNGDHAGCARVYCLAAQSILDPKAKLSSVFLLEGLGPSKIKLEEAVGQTVATPSWRTSQGKGGRGNLNAWAMRKAMDDCLAATRTARTWEVAKWQPVHVQIQGTKLGIAIAVDKGKPGGNVAMIFDTAEAEVKQKVRLGMKLVEVQGQPVGGMMSAGEVAVVIKASTARPLDLVFEPPAVGTAAGGAASAMLPLHQDDWVLGRPFTVDATNPTGVNKTTHFSNRRGGHVYFSATDKRWLLRATAVGGFSAGLLTRDRQAGFAAALPNSAALPASRGVGRRAAVAVPARPAGGSAGATTDSGAGRS